jgi:hypothetical protein
MQAPLPGPLHHHDLIIVVLFCDFHGLGVAAHGLGP